MNGSSAPATVVLVHGGFVDGSGWRPLYDLLTQDGYHVAVVQNPTLSLQGDAAAARLIIDAQDGPVVLVGHFWGGAVISEAGTHPNVAALVYVTAFAPDKDESVNTLIASFPGGRAAAADPAPQGRLPVPGPGQVPRLVRRQPGRVHGRLAGPVGGGRPRLAGTDAMWRTKPSWYLVTTEDRMMPPAAQRTMFQRAGSTVVEVAASHSVYLSQPAQVADLIKQAVAAVAVPR